MYKDANRCKGAINIYYQNVNGLRSKGREFMEFTLNNNYEIICLTESKLDETVGNQELFPSFFNVYRLDRNQKNSRKDRGGGVIVGVSSVLPSQQIIIDEADSLELLCVRAGGHGWYLMVMVIYIPPSSAVDVYEKVVLTIENLMSKYEDENIHWAVMGDFNLPHIQWCEVDIDDELMDGSHGLIPVGTGSLAETTFIDGIDSCGLLQVNFICNTFDKLLDLVYVDITQLFSVFRPVSILHSRDRNHCPVGVSFFTDVNFGFSNHADRGENKVKFNFESIDFNEFAIYLSIIDWSCIFNDADVDTNVSRFYERIYSGLERYAKKIKSRKGNFKYPVWFDTSLIHLHKQKQKAYKTYIQSKSAVDYENYSYLRSNFKALHSIAYDIHLLDIQSCLKSNPKMLWSYVNEKRKTVGLPSEMFYEGRSSSNTREIVGFFRSFFASVYVKHESAELPKSNYVNDGYIIGSVVVNEQIVLEAIRRAKRGCGPDGIPTNFVQRFAPQLVLPLALLFNQSLQAGIFPSQWKISSITPIPKHGKREFVQNYRGISILSVIPKIFESIVANHLKFNILAFIDDAQHGFTARKSTVTNLVCFTNFVSHAIESGKQVDVIYTDFRKAFDSVQHDILLSKLSDIGLSGPLVKWLESYLNDRTQYIEIKGIRSEIINVLSGVPQGSHLGPLLFLVFVNDLTFLIKSCSMLLFADDLKLYAVVESLYDTTLIQRDLDTVYRWCCANKLFLNEQKCNVMSFHRRHFPIVAEYFIDNWKLVRVYEKMDLGVMFVSSLEFAQHINLVITKANRLMGFIMRICREFRDHVALIRLYNAYIRSVLEYASQVWCPYYEIHSSRIERVQKRFTRYIAWKLDHYLPRDTINDGISTDYMSRCMRFGLEPLGIRRDKHRIRFIANILTGSIVCSNILKLLSVNAHVRVTRETSFFYLPWHRTTYGMNEPLSAMMRLFNDFYLDFDFHRDYR